MAATIQDMQRQLDDAYDASVATGELLRVELRNRETAVSSLFSQGQLASVSKNSASQSYAFNVSGAVTTQELAGAWRDLVNLHDRVQRILIAAGTASPTDAEIYVEMVARLFPVYQTRADISGLRCA